MIMIGEFVTRGVTKISYEQSYNQHADQLYNNN
jgi:hypothetical protein